MKIFKSYICSDLHLGSDFMAKLRGYSSAEEFWKALKTCWNATVEEHNAVIIVGDIVQKKEHAPLLLQLKGSKHFVLGNHDNVLKPKDWFEFGTPHAMLVVPELKCLIAHIPVHPETFTYKKADWVQLHGHTHEQNYGHPYINVCPEQIGLVPILVCEALTLRQERAAT